MASQVGKKIVELREFEGLETDCKCSTAGVSFETCPICQMCKVMHSYQADIKLGQGAGRSKLGCHAETLEGWANSTVQKRGTPGSWDIFFQ